MRKVLVIVAGGLTLLILSALLGFFGIPTVVFLLVGIVGAYFVGREIWRGGDARY
jgi:hypothetical protein